MNKNLNKRPCIVILGGGFGGAYCAQALERQIREKEAEVILINRNNYFVFYPLLIEAGTGSLEPRHVVVPERAFLKSATFLMVEVVAVDTEVQEVTYQVPGRKEYETIHYDHLVVALGSVTRLPDVPGLLQYGFEMKHLADAVALRDRAVQMLEAANAVKDEHKRREMLHFVVVGGNYTGVELAGELHTFLHHGARLYRNIRRNDYGVSLVEISDRILPALDRDLSAYAVEKLEKRGIQVRLHCTVSDIQETELKLSNDEVLHTHTLIWCAGIAPPPLLKKLPFPQDVNGYILCEPDLRVKGFENVWAIGDCAVNPDPEGKAYPATAQMAVRQGTFLAANLVKTLRGGKALPLNIKSRGSLVALGCRTGVAKIFGIKISGFPAWFLWRTVYLIKMPQWSRRLRVAIDWTMSLLFSRDYVQLGIIRRPK